MSEHDTTTEVEDDDWWPLPHDAPTCGVVWRCRIWVTEEQEADEYSTLQHVKYTLDKAAAVKFADEFAIENAAASQAADFMADIDGAIITKAETGRAEVSVDDEFEHLGWFNPKTGSIDWD